MTKAIATYRLTPKEATPLFILLNGNKSTLEVSEEIGIQVEKDKRGTTIAIHIPLEGDEERIAQLAGLLDSLEY